MADISFGSKNKVTFPTRFHGDVILSQATWHHICAKPERNYYKYNGDMIPTTLINPDYVRHHSKKATQFLYYKAFARFKIAENIEGPMPCKLMTVVIDTATQRICTVYPTDKMKLGKAFNPR